jgi:hypothetical protein
MAANHGRTPLDFCAAMRRLCHDICARSPELGHIRMDEVAVSFSQARRRVLHGLQARLTPLRFEQGRLVERRGSHDWAIRRMFVDGQEVLYILTFMLPRFLDQPVREKWITIFHELYHISPTFNGDIRRMEGRYHVHSHSQCDYDRRMGELVDEYLADGPPDELAEFLQFNYSDLARRHGGVVGLKLPIPKLVRLPHGSPLLERQSHQQRDAG